MAGSKLKEAKAVAWAENQVCMTLYEDYGKAVETAAKQGISGDKSPDAKKLLGQLKGETDKLEKAAKALGKELENAPLNGPEGALAEDAQQDLDLYNKVSLVIFKRAEDYYKKKFPVKK